jgi:hypothetical protein
MIGVLDPRAPRVEDAAPGETVSQQADNVLNIIQFRTARKDVCEVIRCGKAGLAISRGELACKLDELHTLSLKSAVVALEPQSAALIGQMKIWAMNNLARPGQMAHCDDGTLFGFIASKLMAQDVSLAEESAVDEEFATYLTRSNSVRKSLATAMAQTAGVARAAGGVPPPRAVPPTARDPICPKCHHGHILRLCTAEFATLYKDGPRNPDWQLNPPRRGREGGGGRPAPYSGRPALLAP